jgi:phosphopantetheinyl transferase
MWLAGQTAAKEAVRQLLRSRCGLDLPPADIEIHLDERGRPAVSGPWASSVAASPVVAISDIEGLAVAVAGLRPAAGSHLSETELLLGMHIESPRASPVRCGEAAFTSEELQLLCRLPSEPREQWVLRGWCAKQAVAKAVGADPAGEPPSVVIVGTDPDEGAVFVQLTGELAAAHPDLVSAPLVAFTGLHDGLVVAATFCEFVQARSMDGLAVEGAHGGAN